LRPTESDQAVDRVRYLTWVKTLQLEPAAIATLLEDIAEVDQAQRADFFERLERAIDQAIFEGRPKAIPPRCFRRGCRHCAAWRASRAATIIAELGS